MRKAALGIARDTPHEQRLERITQAREHAISHAPERVTLAQLREQEQTLARTIEGLEHYIEQVQHVQAREAAWVPRVERRGWEEMLEHERVLAEGKDYGLGRDTDTEQTVQQLERFLARLSHEEAQQVGRAFNIRLHERERTRGRGMSW